MIIFVWILNFVISWVNAWGVGKTWNETKHARGFAHFMNWMAAIMSAAGFTWCYMVILGFFGATIPLVEAEDGTRHALLTIQQAQTFFDLGYLVIILPILGSGLAITLNSWGYVWRRRTLGSGAVAGYNTFAQVYNMVEAARYIPKASSNVWSAFFGKDNNSDGKNKIILLMVVLSVAGGILTTWAIVTRTAKATARSRGFEWTRRAEELDEEVA